MRAFHFSIKYLLKARGNNITRIISLTLGLSVALLVFSYIGFVNSNNRCFPEYREIYQVWAHYEEFGYGGQLQGPVAPAMAQDLPQIKCATRTMSWRPFENFKVGDKTFSGFILQADTSFFDVFKIKQISGMDPHDVFSVDENIMISESFAKKVFGKEDPIGKMVLFRNTIPKTICGIYEDIPVNNTFGIVDAMIPLESFRDEENLTWNGGDSFLTFFRLKAGARLVDLEAQIPEFSKKYPGLNSFMTNFKMTFDFKPITQEKYVGSDMEKVVLLLGILGLLTLLVATMNYILVSISALVKRSRTIALLKCNGAHKSDIFQIFLSETAILLLVALILSILLLFTAKGPIKTITSYSAADLFALSRVWVPLIVLVITFLLAGLIPARLFTKIPVTAVFGSVANHRRRWKQILLFIQMVSVSFVMTVLLITLLQFHTLRHGEFGYEHEKIVYVRLCGNLQQYQAYKSELQSLPCVESIGLSNGIPANGYSGNPCIDDVTEEILFTCRYEVWDENYLNTMNMQLVDGENFTENSNNESAIVNQKYVEMRGWTDSPIGKTIMDFSKQRYTIIGVVKDFKQEAGSGVIRPIVVHPWTIWTKHSSFNSSSFYTSIRLSEMTTENLEAVRNVIKQFPAQEYPTVKVYEETIMERLSFVKNIKDMLVLLAVITLLIALIGLFGYLNDEMGRRSREIAIRKVNGATVSEVLILLGRNIFPLAATATVLGLAGAYFTAAKLLQMFETRIELSWWIFAICALTVLILVYTIQIAKTIRIATSSPVQMLRKLSE